MLSEYARARGRSTLDIFHEAAENDADFLYQRWLSNKLILPLCVIRWLESTLKEEDKAEQPWLPFI